MNIYTGLKKNLDISKMFKSILQQIQKERDFRVISPVIKSFKNNVYKNRKKKQFIGLARALEEKEEESEEI